MVGGLCVCCWCACVWLFDGGLVCGVLARMLARLLVCLVGRSLLGWLFD